MAEQRDIIPTYRVLTEPIFDVDIWIIRLTWLEAVICFSSAMLAWTIFEIIGLGRFTILGFSLDPTLAGLIIGVIVVLLISLLHWLRPEGSIEIVVLGWKEPTYYLGRKADLKWKPSLIPHIRKYK